MMIDNRIALSKGISVLGIVPQIDSVAAGCLPLVTKLEVMAKLRAVTKPLFTPLQAAFLPMTSSP